MNDFVSNNGSTNCASEGLTFEEAQESEYKDEENFPQLMREVWLLITIH